MKFRGDILKSARESSGWTLEELSEIVEIPVSSLSDMEHNRMSPSHNQAILLSVHLGIRKYSLYEED